MHTASWLCDLNYGWNFREASALAQVAKCELPMLFIHGDADDYVPTWMVYPLYEAKPGEKELWLVPGAGHAYSYRDNRGNTPPSSGSSSENTSADSAAARSVLEP